MQKKKIVLKDCEDKFKFVAYIDPPAICYDKENYLQKIWTPVHGWSSRAVDRVRGMTITSPAWFEEQTIQDRGIVINSAWDRHGGVAIVGQVSLNEILKYKGDDLLVALGCICVKITYREKNERRGVVACDEVTPEGLIYQEVGEGCNKAGCVYYPGAPRFSKFVENERDKAMDTVEEKSIFRKRPRLDERRVKELFPFMDFGINSKLELLTPKKLLKVR